MHHGCRSSIFWSAPPVLKHELVDNQSQPDVRSGKLKILSGNDKAALSIVLLVTDVRDTASVCWFSFPCLRNFQLLFESMRIPSDRCSTKKVQDGRRMQMLLWRHCADVSRDQTTDGARRCLYNRSVSNATRRVGRELVAYVVASFWKRPGESRIQRHRLSILLPPRLVGLSLRRPCLATNDASLLCVYFVTTTYNNSCLLWTDTTASDLFCYIITAACFFASYPTFLTRYRYAVRIG